jgi:tripeptidyl-peptidase-1
MRMHTTAQDQTARIDVGFQTLGVRGISVFASSGDGGSHFSFGPFSGGATADALNVISCNFQMPVYPTGSPYVVSVGGTAWSGGGGSSTHPVGWSGSGGGFSWEDAMPAHQTKLVSAYLTNQKGAQNFPTLASFNASGRAYPDISALADVVIPLCVYGGCSSTGGTSASCPTVAGMFSLLNDRRAAAGLPALGFVAPRIWDVAASHPGEAFLDVLEGNTKTSCNNGFPADSGWDPVTGFGQPLWPGMLKYFGAAP